jgi:hypothetical protein
MKKLTEVEQIWMGRIHIRGGVHLRIRPSKRDELGAFAVEKENADVLGFVYRDTGEESLQPRYEYHEIGRETSMACFRMPMLIRMLHTYYKAEGLL